MDGVTFVAHIRKVYEAVKTYKGTEEAVWNDLSIDDKVDHGRVRVRQIIKIVLHNRNGFQLELLIDGEPFPLHEIDDTAILIERMYKLRRQARTLNERADAIEAEIKYRKTLGN